MVLHPTTKRAIDNLIVHPVHAVQISGSSGSGKLSISKLIAAQLLGTSEANLLQHPYVKIICPDENSTSKVISIDAIRELQQFLALRIPGTQVIGRIIILQDAHLMAAEAQNALLKSLEEPPDDTVIILTAQSKDSMLPTIQSRVRHLIAVQPAADQLLEYFEQKNHSTAEISKALMISGGLPGLTAALLEGDSSHPLVAATIHARGILQSKAYERLLLVDSLSKQKQLTLDVLYVLSQMAKMSLLKASDIHTSQKWRNILKASYEAQDQIARNVQTKLVLTHLMLII